MKRWKSIKLDRFIDCKSSSLKTVTWVVHVFVGCLLMMYLSCFFRKGKRAVEDIDSDDSSDEEDEESVVLSNGSQVVLDKGTGESSGSVMDGGNASGGSGSEEEKDVVVNQCSDVPKGEVTGVQVVIEEKMDDSSLTVVDAVVQNEKEENSCGDAEKNRVEAASETLVSSVPVKNQGNDSEVKTVGAAGDTESVDAAMCCKPEEPLNFDDFNSAKDMEVFNGFILLIRKVQFKMVSLNITLCSG